MISDFGQLERTVNNTHIKRLVNITQHMVLNTPLAKKLDNCMLINIQATLNRVTIIQSNKSSFSYCNESNLHSKGTRQIVTTTADTVLTQLNAACLGSYWQTNQ